MVEWLRGGGELEVYKPHEVPIRGLPFFFLM